MQHLQQRRLLLIGAASVALVILVVSSVIILHPNGTTTASRASDSTPTFTPPLPPAPTATMAPLPTNPPSPVPPSNVPASLRFNSTASSDLQELHLQSSFNCEPYLVFTRDPANLRNTDIQQMSQYFLNVPNIGQIWNGTVGTVPSSLQWVPGALAKAPDACDGTFEVTNIGQNSVQISGGGVRVLSDPVPNDFQYQFPDLCLLSSQQTNYWGCGRGGGPNCARDLTIPLQAGSGNTDDDVLFAAQGCRDPLVLNPGDTADISVMFTRPTASYIFSLAPELLIINQTGNHRYIWQNQPFTLIYTQESNTSCYALQGGAWTLEPGKDVLSCT